MRSLLSVLLFFFSALVLVSTATPLHEESESEYMKRYFDPIKFMGDPRLMKKYFDPIKFMGDPRLIKKYFDPILFSNPTL
nr:expressed conserved protein [Hymenolepis microstoma]